MLLLLAFLFPLPVYVMALALIHRRQHPLLVPGTWDFAGLLFAVSGFILAGGAYALGSFSSNWRLFWMLGQRRYLGEVPDAYYWVLVWLFVTYFVLVVAGVALLLLRRRNVTVIYNVGPEAFDDALERVFDSLGLPWQRLGRKIFLGPLPKTAPPGTVPVKDWPVGEETPEATLMETASLAEQAAALDLEPSQAMQTVTLVWSLAFEGIDQTLRQEVEAELEKVLTQLPSQAHPVGGWLFTVAAALFALTFLVMAFLVLFPHLTSD